MVLIVILYALLAGTFSLGKILLSYTQPIFLVGVRMSIAGFILLGYHYLRNKASIKINKNHTSLFLQATIFTIYVPYLLRYWGLQYLPSSKACLVYNFGPFVTYFFSYLICNEKITLKKILGLIIGFVGLIPLVVTSPSCVTEAHNAPYMLPEIALLGAVSSMSYGWLIIHKLINKKKYAPSMTNGVIMTLGGILALLTSFIFEDSQYYISDVIPFSILLTIIIIVSNLICHNLYGVLLKRYSPTMLSFTGFLSPIFAALYGWLFMHETIPASFYFSSIAIGIGLSLFYYDELKQQTNLAKAVPVAAE